MLKKTSWLLATAVTLWLRRRGAGRLEADEASRIRRHVGPRRRHRQLRTHRSVHHRQAQADGPADRRHQQGRRQRRRRLRLRARQRPATPTSSRSARTTNTCCPYVAKLAYKPDDLTPVAAMALDEFLLWVNANAPYKDAKSYHRSRQGQARDAQDGRQPVQGHGPDADEHRSKTRPARNSSTCRSRAAGKRRSSSPAATSTRTPTIPNENIGQWKAGMIKPLVRVQPDAAPRGSEGHARPWAGPTFRPARKPASRSTSSRCRAPSGCPPACPPKPWRSTPTPQESQRDAGVEGIYRAHLPDRPLSCRRGTEELHRPGRCEE